ncbi:hypothetical protein O6H91_Y398200 [Diphasiastrum complanatum]|nr:hypothetical protein O6H91_Y398200 [Diphasiastrum complanatum]
MKSKIVAGVVFTMLWMMTMETEVYMVIVDGDPVVHYQGNVPGLAATAASRGQKMDGSRLPLKEAVKLYSAYLVEQHDLLLQSTFKSSTYKKLYSYLNVINGFAVHITSEQADILSKAHGVKVIQKDWPMKTLTTHTPDFLGLPKGIWAMEGGVNKAGEGIVIGFIDTGIDPTHPSFSSEGSTPYEHIYGYTGKCEIAAVSPHTFCNGKIVGAQHFAAAAAAAGNFNTSSFLASPIDGDGHGSHTASIAAGNHGVPVQVDGFTYGNASGMAPRARIAVYKALYPKLGGFVADVVAAIDQAVSDGVDILSLSVGPASPPSSSSTTFMNVFDMALLAAVKVGIFVAQAGGNDGPYPRTIVSFSPWIITVAAGVDDRRYPNKLSLGNNQTLAGIGLAPSTSGSTLYNLILAKDAVGSQSDLFFSPNDCQDPTLFDKKIVQGNILICTYSFSFIFGGATINQVAVTVQNVSAVGFILVVESDLAGSKFDPIPISVPGIVLTTLEDSSNLLNYYNISTQRNSAGNVISLGATAKIGNGQLAVFNSSAPQVAQFSARGPDVRNFAFQDADILKPDILAPGSLIWGAWTPSGVDEPNFIGKNFAMVSGTSMATPHIAGIAALLKEKYPDWSPAAIASAMRTTALVVNELGNPILAQHLSKTGISSFGPATPFDYGGGAIDATAALDPGLIFDAGYEDYLNFLCAVPGVDRLSIFNATRASCGQIPGAMSDLNLPSITIASLNASRVVARTVTNVAETETYTFSYTEPAGVSITVVPKVFTIQEGQKFSFVVYLNATVASEDSTFGELNLTGNCGHTVRIPLSIVRTQLS